jgi:hypothetical protein
VLGIAGRAGRLRAIEAGEATEAQFAAVGDDWDVEERALAVLEGLGLGHLGLDRRVGEVSGGEAVLLGLAAELLRRPDVLLLDLAQPPPSYAAPTRSGPGGRGGMFWLRWNRLVGSQRALTAARRSQVAFG